MKRFSCVILFAFCLMAPGMATASEFPDQLGKLDTIYAELHQLDKSNWSITISMTNDENLVGLQLPMKMTSGLTRIVVDSIVYEGGRVADWAYLGKRADTAIQCVLLGMIANLGPSQKRLTPGSGRLATVFVSSIDDVPIDKLAVDTVTLSNISILAIADANQGTLPDTTSIGWDKRQLVPAWVIKKSK